MDNLGETINRNIQLHIHIFLRTHLPLQSFCTLYQELWNFSLWRHAAVDTHFSLTVLQVTFLSLEKLNFVSHNIHRILLHVSERFHTKQVWYKTRSFKRDLLTITFPQMLVIWRAKGRTFNSYRIRKMYVESINVNSSNWSNCCDDLKS